jgi:hypothetical protein
MRTREKLISVIESLYPADAGYPRTAAIGRELLAEAKDLRSNWRNEPLDVLEEYARLCEKLEAEVARDHSKRG